MYRVLSRDIVRCDVRCAAWCATGAGRLAVTVGVLFPAPSMRVMRHPSRHPGRGQLVCCIYVAMYIVLPHDMCQRTRLVYMVRSLCTSWSPVICANTRRERDDYFGAGGTYVQRLDGVRRVHVVVVLADHRRLDDVPDRRPGLVDLRRVAVAQRVR